MLNLLDADSGRKGEGMENEAHVYPPHKVSLAIKVPTGLALEAKRLCGEFDLNVTQSVIAVLKMGLKNLETRLASEGVDDVNERKG